MAKNNLVRGHLFIKSAKTSKVRIPALSAYPQISNFCPSSLPLLEVTNWHSIAPDNFENFHKNFNNKIKLVT